MSRHVRGRIAVLAIASVVLSACGATGIASSAGAPTTARPAHSAFVTFPPNFTPDVPTPDPTVDTPTTGQYKAGEVIHVTNNGSPWAEITVSKVSVKKKYDGPYNLDDVPKSGNVYIQAYVAYKALDNGVDYNPFDWQVFVNDQAVDDTGYVSNGPTPELGSGTLPKGRKAGGWVVYQVPAKGAVRMSYGGTFSNEAPVFEVLIRPK